MNESLALAETGGHPATAPSLVHWEFALQTLLNTLSSPRTSTACGRTIRQAMQSMSVDFVADLDPPLLADYRSRLVARLDVDRGDRPSPSTVNL